MAQQPVKQEIAPTDLDEVRSFDEIREQFRAEEEADRQKIKNAAGKVSNMAMRSARLAGNAVTGSAATATRTLGSKIRMGIPMFVPVDLGTVLDHNDAARAEGRNVKVLGYTDEMLTNMDELDARRVIDAGLASDPESETVKNFMTRREADVGSGTYSHTVMPETPVQSTVRRVKVLPEKPAPQIFNMDTAMKNEGYSSFEDLYKSMEGMFVDANAEPQQDNRVAEFDDSTDDFVTELPKTSGIDREAMAEEIVAPVRQRAMRDALLDKEMSDRLFGHGGAYM